VIPVADHQPVLRRLQENVFSRFYGWRDGLVASGRFQRWAAAFPVTRSTAAVHSRSLFDLCAGFVYTQVLTACVELDLFPILAKGPRSARSLAPELALSVEAAERLLKAAVALDLCALRPVQAGDGEPRYGLGMLGAALLGNPGVISMIHHNRLLYADLADPVALLRGKPGKTDQTAPRTATALSRFWPYARDDASGADAATSPYSALMSASQSLVAEDIIEAYPFRAHRVVMDVGGGDGTFLTRLAAHAPQLRLILFDLPSVAAQAEARFAREGLSGRASAVGGDAAAGPLPQGADLITLVRVLHDHDDAKVLAILTQARKALPPGGILLIAEPMAGIKGAEAMADAYFGFYLLAMGSGRARTSGELRLLLEQAGFNDISTLKTRRPLMTSAMKACVRIKRE
jgi:demethylspheroidene O-methyltransferase